MAKQKAKEPQATEQASPSAERLGGDDKHPDVDHSHAGYLSQEDADIRLQRAQGDSRASTPQE